MHGNADSVFRWGAAIGALVVAAVALVIGFTHSAQPRIQIAHFGGSTFSESSDTSFSVTSAWWATVSKSGRVRIKRFTFHAVRTPFDFFR